MEFRDWEPVYERIVRDFGYSREEDEMAARELAVLALDKPLCDDVCLTNVREHGLYHHRAIAVWE
jgi:uncharacterized Rossmann fold enzyme